MSSVGSRTGSGATSRPSRPSSSRRAAWAPISVCGIATVVNGGSRLATIGVSLWPTSETSSGQRSPASASARRQPSAIRSLPARIAVYRSPELRSSAAVSSPAARRERLAVNHPRGRAHAEPFDRRLERVAADDRGRQGQRPGDVSDPPMAELGEVGDGGLDARGIVAGDERQRAGIDVPGDENRRHVAVGEIVDGPARPRRGGDDQALAAPREELVDEHRLALDVIVGIRQQAGDSRGPQHALDPAHDGRDHRVGEIRHDDAHEPGPACAEAARHRVRPVAERLGRLAHPALGRRRDPAGQRRVQRPRGRRGVDARSAGDVPQRRSRRRQARSPVARGRSRRVRREPSTRRTPCLPWPPRRSRTPGPSPPGRPA